MIEIIVTCDNCSFLFSRSEHPEQPRIPDIEDPELSMFSFFSFRLPATAL